ncbi:alpha/beta fold hydrolase [Acidimicrobiia bacterium EGI L10123]|uniref:alpha/beta fold hydrolase n=1 Tax=Salinilacustrithrix flava TaxID=2957203 RepID=UPI003D7C15F2|nr:alpha/beta fold hydrolase [Acidimicrobiia bacterium EGI L10123]
MPSVDVNGITLEYERSGAGEPLLLIMGLGAQLTAWPAEMVQLLEDAGFDVIRFDNRDIGLSSECDWEPPSPVRAFIGRLLRRPVPTGYVVDDMADDAAGLLDALGIDRAHVVGASMGGMIAQALAIAHPRRVASLTSIMSNPGDGSGGATAKVLLAFARRDDPTPENAVDQAVATFQRISGPHFRAEEYRPLAEAAVARSFRPHGVARQTAAVMASADRTEGLSRLAVPALVVHGLIDPLVKPSGGIATAQAIPGSRLLMFNDMAHDLPAPRLGEIVDAIARVAAGDHPS